MRQALAGMLWSKQHYYFDLDRWLDEHHVHPLRDSGGTDVRNRSWFHMVNDDVISMPDTWEYPWYASWDLAFHTVALAMVDIDFAKDQLELMLRELYLHPSGQLPAYEWNFSDVNPPVHAWATLLVYETELEQRGEGDVAWLKSAFQKLLVNFTWWINRKDPTGRNVFEGGFLGLDNIGVFDRSAPLPDRRPPRAVRRHRVDGVLLAVHARHRPRAVPARPAVRGHGAQVRRALRCSSPRRWTASATTRTSCGTRRTASSTTCCACPTAAPQRLKVRSMVGLLPLCATTILPIERRRSSSEDLLARLRRRIEAMPELLATIHDARVPGRQRAAHAGRARRDQAAPGPRPDARRGRVPRARTACGRCRATTPTIRSASTSTARRYEVALPARRVGHRACSAATRTGAGPVWFPVNYLVLRGLLHLYAYYGDDFKVECPTGLGQPVHAVRGGDGARPAAGVDLRPRRGRPPPGLRRHRAVPDRPATGRTCCCSTSTSTATTAPASAPATRPAGPASSRRSSR